MIRTEEGKFYGSVIKEPGRFTAPVVERFGPFNTAEEAFETAYAALESRPGFTRLVIGRGDRHEVLNVVDETWVAQWDFDRRTMAVVDTYLAADVRDYVADRRAAGVEAEQDEALTVSHYAERAMRLGALEPWASSFARWAVRERKTGNLGAAYDEWRKGRGWETRAEMDARHKFMTSLSTSDLVDWVRAGSPMPWHVLTA
jgi:hypothetical protein